MAASNKPTAVHFATAFFGMTTLILGVTTYLGYKDLGTAQNDVTARTEEANNANSALSRTINDLEMIKNDLGLDFSDVGAEDPPPQNTVRGGIRKSLAENGKDLQEPTVVATIAAMRSAYDQLQADLAQKEQANQEMQERLLALQTQYQAEVDKHNDSQTTSETNLQEFIRQRDEILAQKDQELSTIRADYNRELVEKAQLKEQFNNAVADLEDQIGKLERTNGLLRDELDGIKRISFEVPDGEIRNVDNTTRTVWLNLGELDGVREQVTFSVYDQGHYGIARGPEDVKGSVEVVRVLGPHLCEARILTEQLNRPMTPGDVVYSPIWQAGLVEQFAFVGLIDFEGDGHSDRKMMHDLLNHADARITLEVDDEGNRVPPDARINVNTKFLVIGEIPDPAQFPVQDPRLEQAKRISAQKGDLEQDAKQQGVRVVRLNDFLAYMGYKPQQRLFLPGSDMPYTIQRGVPTTGTIESIGAGATSEIFRKNRATGGGNELYSN